MLFPIVLLSVIFIAIGFIVTENNAKYLLSGYNAMSEEERKKVNIKAFIPYFRKFHIFLGISFFVFGIALDYFVGKTATNAFIGLYPIVAYIYFIITSTKYSEQGMSKWDKIGIIGLFVLLAFLVVGIFSSKL